MLKLKLNFLSEFEIALEKINYDVIGRSETKRNGEGIIYCKNFRFFYNGKTSRSISNEKNASVGFVVHKRWINNIKSQINISLRVMVITLKINDSATLGLVQVYAPTSRAKDDEMN